MVVPNRDVDPRQQDSALGPMPPTPPADEKPYHAKRPHRKSRMGCRNCKTRKVKCDEKKPSCRNCTLRKEACLYPPTSHSHSESHSSDGAASRSTTGSAPALGSGPGPGPATISASASASALRAPASGSGSGEGPAATARPQILTPTVSFTALSAGALRVFPSPVTPSVSSASPLSQRAAVSPATSTALSLAQGSPAAPHDDGSRRESHDASSTSDTETTTELIMVEEPPFKFGGADEYDMKLLWFYTTETYASFSVETGRIPFIDRILKSTIPKFAFQSPFLMDCILGLSALHMQSLNVPVPLSKAISYRARAFAGYRQAIERADAQDFPALLVCSLLLTALSSELFREADTKPLYIIDWMVVWRGIGLIFDIIPVETLYDAGLEKLFSRPAFDLNQAALYIPNNLLFMVSSINEGDEEFFHKSTYYDTLKFLGGVYCELEAGFSPVLSLRIITWFTFLPKPFIELARKHRPRALLILAHYLTFLKLVPNVWWLAGIGDRGIQDIVDAVGLEWQNLLSVPVAAMQISDRVELAKLIKGNHAWEPSTEKASTPPPMAMVNNDGEEVAYDQQRGWVPLFHAARSQSDSNATPSPEYVTNLLPPQS